MSQTSSHTAEALAARDGMLLALEQGAVKVILEMDSTQLVYLLRSNEGIYSAISGIWHEITEICRLFSVVDFSYVPRGGNEVAHTCANMPSSSSPSFSWAGSLPNWLLLEVAAKDCTDPLNE
jgi:ribonuclease HI